jgi:Xaa-Pro aminopeptidase
MTPHEKLKALRQRISSEKLDGYIIPRGDEHKNEYVPDCAKRLEWLTGFTGSAGLSIVLSNEAFVFSDGRYVEQIAREVNADLYEYGRTENNGFVAFLKTLPPKSLIGYDPWLHSQNEIRNYEKATEPLHIEFVPTQNLIDPIWSSRPPRPKGLAYKHAHAYTGQDYTQKFEAVLQKINEKKADYLVLSSLDSICWLLNIRGSDIDFNPFVLCYALISDRGELFLFVDEGKITPEIKEELGPNTHFFDYTGFSSYLEALKPSSVWVDPTSTPYAILLILKAKEHPLVEAGDPCVLPKACKNKIEIQGARNAHQRDGLAMICFLSWIEKRLEENKPLDELTAQDKLFEFRQSMPLFKEVCFGTISGFGPNGSVMHYHSSPSTNLSFKEGNLYLVDSGGQYLDGTTDITRTIAIGTPSEEHKRNFTLVLKGHIRLALCRFPEGTTGHQLDALARFDLWQHGLDYAHGTGHGVGSFLSVHEGPQRIAKAFNTVSLVPGMILSNEPGYYKPGYYGIRLENLVVVQEDKKQNDEELMYCFETLTLVPFDKKCLDLSLLTPLEIKWINDYHARIFKIQSPFLEEGDQKWLKAQCEALF